ncbi:MAG: arginine N-succinyltransferase, partial [Marinomonas sp.]
GYVDIFDGGPSMLARTDNVNSVKDAVQANLSGLECQGGEKALIATGTLADFAACYGVREAASDGSIAIDSVAADTLDVSEGDNVWSVAR